MAHKINKAIQKLDELIASGIKSHSLTILCHRLEGVRRKVDCVCDCGNKITADSQNVLRGLTKSCGCLKKTARRTHGKYKTREYKLWHNMRSRCINSKTPMYQYYGGRGIAICQEWVDSFEKFYEDIGPRPSPQHSLDRIDNEKGYFKENVRWVTRTEQMRNTRANHMVIHEGKEMCITEYAAATGQTPGAVFTRIKRKGTHLPLATPQPAT